MRLGDNLGEMKRLYKRGKFNGAAILFGLIEVVLLTMKISASTEVELNTHSDGVVHQTVTAKDEIDIIETEPETEKHVEETTTEIETETETVVEQTISPEPGWYVYLTSDEMYALACLVWLEGRGESIQCQQAIASVVINRYTTDRDKYNNLFDVIYEPKQFSPAGLIPQTQPSQIQIDVVYTIAMYGPNIPEYVTYFRADYFHDWGDQVPYQCMGSTYFSYSECLKFELESTGGIK